MAPHSIIKFMMTPQKTKQEFHFPGNANTAPMTVEAESNEEAISIYKNKINNTPEPAKSPEPAVDEDEFDGINEDDDDEESFEEN